MTIAIADMPRIVYLHQYFNTRQGEGGTRSYEFARRLAERGYDVQLVTSDRSANDVAGPKWRVEQIEGFTVHWLAEPYSNSMSFTRRIWAFLRFAVRSSRKARSLRGDLIFATSTPLTIIVPAIVAKVARRTPIVFEVRDLWPELPIAVGAIKGRVPIALARFLEEFAYQSATEIIALSEGMKAGVVAAGTAPERVTVIPNASDIDLFTPSEGDIDAFLTKHPELRDRKIVAYAGTLGLINGVGYLIDVARETSKIDPNIAFVIVGDGAEREPLRRKAEIDGLLGKNVHLWGQIPKTDVPALFAVSTAVTSLFVPIKAMEANSANKFFDGLAAGRPVLVNYDGWHRELVEEYEAGLRLDPRRPDKAARYIADLVNDNDRCARLGANARELALTSFDRNELATTFIEVLERALYHKRK